MQPLRTVSAYKDGKPILEVPTRWSPRKVLCKEPLLTKTATERQYAVKYRRRNSPASSAAAISEVVCHALMKMIGLRTLDAVLVDISSDLARSYAQSGILDYVVEDGLHFGTLLRTDLLSAEFHSDSPAPTWEQLARPEELILIWAADTWLMNLDRVVFGNILLEWDAGNGHWHLIPADQSDCFLGSASLADGSYKRRAETHLGAPYLRMLERALYDLGPRPLQNVVRLIGEAKSHVHEAVARVPQPWWDTSNVRPNELMECLRQRADRIHALVELAKWENIPHGPDGAIILNL